MKNVIKGFAFAAVVLFLAACKNDKPTTAATESAATTATQATETVAMATPAAAIPIAAAPVAAAASAATAAAAAAKPAVTPVKPTPTTEPVKVAPSAAAVTPAPAVAGGGKTTSAKFDETSYDWGTIPEGEKMTHIFKFKNTGANDMIISDAHGSCGCTVPEWPKEPIKPGKMSQIKVIFDSKGKAGDQTKSVTITANTEPTNMVLMIKGKVTAKDEKK